MKDILLQAKYPIQDSQESVEIAVTNPELDRHPPHADYFCIGKISAPGYEQDFEVYGVDPLQATWLTLRRIRDLLTEFEQKTNKKCDYYYFQEYEK